MFFLNSKLICFSLINYFSLQALEEEEKKCMNSMENLLELLSGLFSSAVVKAYPDIPEVTVPITTSSAPQFGDYQCNAAMPIAQILKGQGIHNLHCSFWFFLLRPKQLDSMSQF